MVVKEDECLTITLEKGTIAKKIAFSMGRLLPLRGLELSDESPSRER